MSFPPPPPILHATAKNAETLVQTTWEPLTLYTGWTSATGIRPPSICKVGQIVFISGVLVRNAGGSVGSMAKIPEKYCPTGLPQFIGAGTASNGGAFELSLRPNGELRCEGYTGAGNMAGPAYPISCCYVPIRD